MAIELIDNFNLSISDGLIVPLSVKNEAHDSSEVSILFTVYRQMYRVHFKVKSYIVNGVFR